MQLPQITTLNHFIMSEIITSEIRRNYYRQFNNSRLPRQTLQPVRRDKGLFAYLFMHIMSKEQCNVHACVHVIILATVLL